MHEDILKVASRRTIYECVQDNPGAHLRDISRRTNLPLGTTLYHLDLLESRDLISARRDGRYKRYFCGLEVGRREKDLLSALRHEAPRRIVHALLLQGESTQRELCRAIDLSRSTLSFHVNDLVDREIVTRKSARPENLYSLAEPDLSRELLLRYSESLGVEETRTLLPIEPLILQARDQQAQHEQQTAVPS